MAPTRELAIQIDEELKTFIKGLKIFSVCCVGGAYIGKQISELRYFNNFIIGTPGRLKDLIERRSLNLSKCNNLVLDEADRMLDMGFINDMKYVMGLMPKERQTLFFSATLDPEIERIINDFLKNPVRISVKTRDTAKSIDQDVVRVSGAHKLDVLHELLVQPEFSKVLIFGRTKHGVEKLTNMLADRGFKAVSIHGDKAHAQRQRALKLFKDNTVQMMVATDVAARGLDIPNVSHVINYDLPETYEDYVHRIGRTGRADKTGKALTFVD
jgi:superfamily II DNA/RNA helicase